VDATGQHEGTPLHWAAFLGNAEMAKLILQFGPPLEARDAEFQGTPLDWAIHGSAHGWCANTGEFSSIVKALLAAGANRPDAIGGSPAVQEVLRSEE
jgi:hypothetical protein